MKLVSSLPVPRLKRATPGSLKSSGPQNASVKPGCAGLPLLSPMLPALPLASPPHSTTSGTPFKYSIWLPPFPCSCSWPQSLASHLSMSSYHLLFCFPSLHVLSPSCSAFPSSASTTHSHDWYSQCMLGSLTTFLYCMHVLVLTMPN